MSAPLKYCGGCGCHKPHELFSKNKRRKDGLAIQCKDCYRAYHAKRMAEDAEYVERKRAAKAQWYAENKDKAKAAWRETTAKWKRSNPEKQAQYAHKRRVLGGSGPSSFTAVDVNARLKWQKGKCAVCRCSLSGGYHIDHIMPLARGGTNEPRNIQILCRPCNLKKNAKDPIEFMQSMGLML